MTILGRKLPSLLAAGAIAAGFITAGAASASAASAPDLTCAGGSFTSPTSIAGGTYHSITVSGHCAINAGNVWVQRNVTIGGGASLEGDWAGSRLTVYRDLLVKPGGDVFLGCDPVENTCMDGDGISRHTIWGNFVASGGGLVVSHDNYIGGEVAMDGGGGGFGCSNLFEGGFPPFVDFAGNYIGGDATVADLKTCWDGFSHNWVGGSVNLNDNSTTTPDGNLADGNIVIGNMSCFENAPAPHLSDGPTQIMNEVGGVARGQCAAISTGLE